MVSCAPVDYRRSAVSVRPTTTEGRSSFCTPSCFEEALRNQYSIGYTPREAGKSGEYRKIKLTVKKRGLVVQARDGYHAK